MAEQVFNVESFTTAYSSVYCYHLKDVDPFVALTSLEPGEDILDLGYVYE